MDAEKIIIAGLPSGPGRAVGMPQRPGCGQMGQETVALAGSSEHEEMMSESVVCLPVKRAPRHKTTCLKGRSTETSPSAQPWKVAGFSVGAAPRRSWHSQGGKGRTMERSSGEDFPWGQCPSKKTRGPGT